MIVDDSSPPARATVSRRIAGSGFATPNVSAPQIAANRGLKPRLIEQQFRQPFELVGADRKPKPLTLQIVQRGHQPLERARGVGDMRGVVIDEILGHAVDVFDAGRAALDLEPAISCAPAPIMMRAVRKRIGGLEVEGRAASVEDVNRMTKDFIDYYAAHIADASRPFEGLVAALDDLERQGFRFAVCTNKLEWLSKLLLDQLGLSPRFAAICGADTFGVAKPDPAILRETVARAGGELSSTIMVGDAGPDVGVARRAGIPVIGVEFATPMFPWRPQTRSADRSHARPARCRGQPDPGLKCLIRH